MITFWANGGAASFVAVANNHFTISLISGQFSEINMPATCYGYNEIELKRNYGYQTDRCQHI